MIKDWKDPEVVCRMSNEMKKARMNEIARVADMGMCMSSADSFASGSVQSFMLSTA